MALRDNPSVKPFWQHGFTPERENDSQVWGGCPFCQREKKFYLNKETKAWDCKVCGRSGGYQSFLSMMADHCADAFRGDLKARVRLSKSRSLKVDTLRHFNVGVNPANGVFTIPVLDANRDKVWDLRMFKSGRLMSTAGCKTGLFGWENLADKKGTVWLCEGEWDGMAMWEILDKLGESDDVMCAVPGAETFKSEWIPLLTGRNVCVLYDNDEAGKNGSKKVYNLLKPGARSLKFIEWPMSFTDGYDLRDLYKQAKTAERCMRQVRSMLRDLPPGVSADEARSMGTSGTREKYDGAGLTAQEVYIRYRDWLHLPDTTVLDVLYGTLIANRLPGDPLWLFLVAPPGLTKSEFLQSLNGAKGIESVSTLTPHALVSGANLAGGVDPSLIPQLDGKVLVIKDFTTILQMNPLAREEIFSVLRDAYDGEISKMFGHGVFRHYQSKFGIIAGVTPAIDVFMENESALGERFLRFNVSLPKGLGENLDFLRRATSNVAREDNMRKDLRSIGAQALDYNYARPSSIPDAIHERVLYLSMWTSLLRSTIIRDKFSKEIMHKPFTEAGTRLSKQFTKLLIGIGMFRRLDEIGFDEYRIAASLARGTVPTRMLEFVRAIHREEITRVYGMKELCEIVSLPKASCYRVAEDLSVLGVLRKVSHSSLKQDYQFSEEFMEITEKAEVFV